MWGARYQAHPGYLLGFHGCDRKVKERILAGKEHLKPSDKQYDWLGGGIYFWEASPQRALEWAQWMQSRPNSKVTDPCVIGAVIDPGVCCNLHDRASLDELAGAYDLLKSAGKPIRENENPDGTTSDDLVLRFRDRAVIEFMHAVRSWKNVQEYDTLRCAFTEGKRLFEGAGLREKNHIQIAVRNTACIKGYFRPIPEAMDKSKVKR